VDENLKQQLLLAREHYAQREFDKAAPLLRAVLEGGLDFADVRNMLGCIEHSRGEFTEARRHFESAVALNPNYTEAAINLSVTLNELGQFADARAIHQRLSARGVGALSRTPDDIEPFAKGKLANLHATVAEAYADLGLLAHAIDEYRKALALCPTFADLRTRLGNVLRDSGQLEEAEATYREAIASNPRFLPPRVQLGVARFSRGDRAGAEAAWQQALEIDPNDRFASMYLRMSRANRMRPSMSTMQAVRTDADEPTRKGE
jgi:tetratricopeptide (TPR) repeat protein